MLHLWALLQGPACTQASCPVLWSSIGPRPLCPLFLPFSSFLTLAPAPGLRPHLMPPFLRETLPDPFMPWTNLPSQTVTTKLVQVTAKFRLDLGLKKCHGDLFIFLTLGPHFFGEGFKEMCILHGAKMAAMAPASSFNFKPSGKSGYTSPRILINTPEISLDGLGYLTPSIYLFQDQPLSLLGNNTLICQDAVRPCATPEAKNYVYVGSPNPNWDFRQQAEWILGKKVNVCQDFWHVCIALFLFDNYVLMHVI